MTYCSNCGAEANGNFCANCGRSSTGLEPVNQQTPDSTNTVNYRELLSNQDDRDLIAHHATLSRQQMSGEEYLKLCDMALVPLVGVSVTAIASVVRPIYARLGIRTGKIRSATFNKPFGKILVALLCSLARHGQKVRYVRQGQDGCVIEAIIPSNLLSWEGTLIVSIQSNGDSTHVEAATSIQGQLYDWGKSNRCLEKLFSNLSMTPGLM
ncbi:hypothetical protein [Nostoc sp. PCC 9305]|uniref:hypothetical protein n=1 Tax=Nostoc sp. PCC 9305 TaxID=296636 RepID=UPI0039C632DC